MRSTKKFNRNLVFNLYILVIALLTFIFNFDSGPGQDNNTSRMNYLSGNSDNFLSGVASIFYGTLPDNVFKWWQYLILIQLIVACVGLRLLFADSVNLVSKINLVALYFFCYLTINLASAQSRDGFMISFTLLVFGVLLKYGQNKFAFFSAYIIYVFTFAFRPWLAVSFFPLLIYIFYSKFKLRALINLVVCTFLVISPYILEVTAAKIYKINPAYPQQTVMIHDLATTFCLSPISETQRLAEKGLMILSKEKNSITGLCTFYKPNTWGSSLAAVDSDLQPILSLIQPGDYYQYKKLQAAWLKTINADLKTYIQNKLYFSTQVLIAGESTSINLGSSIKSLTKKVTPASIFEVFRELFFFPWKIIIGLHLISPIFLYLLFIVLSKYDILKNNYTEHKVLILVLSIWLIATIIGYVSDNGRYTYLPALLILGNWLRNSNQPLRNTQ